MCPIPFDAPKVHVIPLWCNLVFNSILRVSVHVYVVGHEQCLCGPRNSRRFARLIVTGELCRMCEAMAECLIGYAQKSLGIDSPSRDW